MDNTIKPTRPLILFTSIILLLITATSNAAIITLTDKFDPSSDQLISFGNNISYSFTHSVIADQDGTGNLWSGSYGYNSLIDTITNASIALRFKDESSDGALESVQLIFDGQSFGTQTVTSGGAIYTATISSDWGTLLNDGILNVKLENAGTTNGHQDGRSDFLFLDSTLTVDIERGGALPAAQISEPAPLTLIGLGLVSLLFTRRKHA